jgi:microcompartment protein CcmL/EutN
MSSATSSPTPSSPRNSGEASGLAGPNVVSTAAIAAVETSSIAQGIVAADAMMKRAEIDLLQASVLSPGRYWILIGGRVADVRSSHGRGVEIAADTLLDQLFIPQLHDGVLPALRGVVAPSAADAVAVIETLTAASAIVAADAAAKAAAIVLADLRLANGIGGKGVVTITGQLPDVEAAVAAGRADAQKRGLLARAVVIARMHPMLREHLV